MIPSQKSSSVRKFLLSSGLIIVSAVYAVWQSIVGQSAITTAPTKTTPDQSYKAANDALLQTLSNLTSTTSSTSPTTNQTPSMAGRYVDGSYTGNAVDAFYGILQVKAVVQGGRIADVQFLQYANNTDNSRFINEQAMPLLTQEAIQAQSAQVDGVSGATFTSNAFRESLASALVQAKI